MVTHQLCSLVGNMNDNNINKTLRDYHDSCIEISTKIGQTYNIMLIIIVLSVNRYRPCPINHFEDNIVNANWYSLVYRA